MEDTSETGEFHWPPVVNPVTVRFRRSYISLHGLGSFGRGELATFAHDEAQQLLDRSIAVLPDAPLDPPPPDMTPVFVRLLRSWRTITGQYFAPTERVEIPKHEADKLIVAGGAVLDDGSDATELTTDPQAIRRSRVLERGRRLAQQTLEKYR